MRYGHLVIHVIPDISSDKSKVTNQVVPLGEDMSSFSHQTSLSEALALTPQPNPYFGQKY